jgi:PHD/YefM family antitoxin component YafN of YafNO toxin-antitoxin module
MSVEISSLSEEDMKDFLGEPTETLDTTLGTEAIETPTVPTPNTEPKTDTSLITPEIVKDKEIGGLEVDEEDFEKEGGTDGISIDFSKYYEMMVDKGLWSKVTDNQGKPLDTIELNAEQFQELSFKQAEWKAEELLQSKEEEFGNQYNQLLEYVKNGGKVEDLASSYAEEKDLDAYDTEDTDDAKQLVESYYKALGWTDKKISNYIEMLEDKADESLKEEAEEAKEKLLDSVKESREQVLEQQRSYQQIQKDSRDRFNKNIRETIYRTDIPERDKKSLDSFFFDYKHNTPQGRFSDYALKIREIQEDPSKFTKLLQFVKDIDSFQAKKETEKEVNKKVFDLFKTGVSKNIANSQQPEKVENKKLQPKNPFTFNKG